MKANKYFRKSDITIQLERYELTINENSYPLSEINFAKLHVVKPRRDYAFLLMLMGLLLLLEEKTLFAVGGILILLGFIAWVSGIEKYSIILNTSIGDITVFTSYDRLLIQEIINSIDVAKECTALSDQISSESD